MIEEKTKVRRYVAEFSEETEELLVTYELSSFNLIEFQREFRESNPRNPMFDSYSINEFNLEFLSKYMFKEPVWDFLNKSYCVECCEI
jgi:hypothetical protein